MRLILEVFLKTFVGAFIGIITLSTYIALVEFVDNFRPVGSNKLTSMIWTSIGLIASYTLGDYLFSFM